MIMKPIKYLVAGALMLSISTSSMAQTSALQQEIDAITQTVTAANGDVKATKDAVKLFLKSYKKNPEALAGLGRAYMAAHNFTEATKYAEMARKVGKNVAAGYILQGDIFAVQDDGGNAATWYQQATMFDPQDATGYVKYAKVYQKIDPKGAVEMLEKLHQVKPDYPYEAAASYMYSQNNKLKTAMEWYDKVPNVKALDDYILYDYLSTAYSLEQYDKAYSLAQAGMQKNPEFASFAKMAYFSCNKLEKFSEAVNYAQRYFSTEKPENIRPADYLYYADALKGAGRLDEAVAQYQKVIELDNTKSEILKSLSEIYMQKKQFDRALELQNQYISAIGSEATYKDYEAIADIYIEQSESVAESEKNKALAGADLAYATIADKFDYAKEYAVYKRANIHHQMNTDIKAGAAKPYYEEYISLVENKAEKSAADLRKLGVCYNYLAVYFIQNDQTAKAKEYAKKLQELQPDNDTAKQILAL